MAIDSAALQRRTFLAAAVLSGMSLPVAAGARQTLAATWERPDGRWRVGLLARDQSVLRVVRQVEAPTRAHGLAHIGGGRLLAVARRPGDWLLQWEPAAGRERWTWAESDRCFTGHVVLDAAAGRVYTGETNLASGAGLIGVRDARSLEKVDEWPTHGRDPHQFLLDGAGGLMVANGGIETRPESGRRKLALEAMDSSLVRLDTSSGRLDGQWRLQDRRLSLRHLAWSGPSARRVLGIAMQAEHDEAAHREAAPVLALFDGRELQAAAASTGLAGYGGDIAAQGRGFAVSAPRADSVALFGTAGRQLGRKRLAQACALVEAGGELLAAGGSGVAIAGSIQLRAPDAIRLDNHWILT